MGSSSFPSEEIQRLQQQNSSLREVVTEMRRQMETLGTEVTLPQNQMRTRPNDLKPSSTAGTNYRTVYGSTSLKTPCPANICDFIVVRAVRQHGLYIN